MMGTLTADVEPVSNRDRVARTRATRQRRGQTNYYRGASAEEQVEAGYLRSGHSLRNRRWRGGVGEIDLVMEKEGEIVFVEVKASRSHAEAAGALRQGQIARLLQSAEAYIGQLPTGLMTPMRFDVALVDQAGRIDVIENALGV